MKLSTKIILPIILISALLILLAGCFGIPDSSPGYTPGSITGRIMVPVDCSDCLTDGPCLPPKGISVDVPSHWVSAEEAIVTVIPHATLTDEDGYYTLTNVEPGVYYVITATYKNLVLKDVVEPDGVEAGKTYEAGTANCESTALGLYVEYLWDMGMDADEIELLVETYIETDKFAELVDTVCCIIEDCDNVTNYCCLVECDDPGYTPELESITVNTGSMNLCLNASKSITPLVSIIAHYTEGEPSKTVTSSASITYSSNDSSIASISGTTVIAGNSVASTFINVSATYTEGDITVDSTGTVPVSVIDCSTCIPELDSLTVVLGNTTPMTLCDGATTTIASNHIASIIAHYTCDAPDVTLLLSECSYTPGDNKISISGLNVTGNSVGSTYIEVSYIDGGKTVTATQEVPVEVEDCSTCIPELDSLTVVLGNTTSMTLCDGATTTIASNHIASIIAHYTCGEDDVYLTLSECDYESEAPGIASVSGLDVTGNSVGSTNIVVSYTDLGKTVTATQKVPVVVEDCSSDDVLTFVEVRGYNGNSGACTGLQETYTVNTLPIPSYIDPGFSWLYLKSSATPNVKWINFTAICDDPSATTIEYRHKYKLQYELTSVTSDWSDWSPMYSWSILTGAVSGCMDAPSSPSDKFFCCEFVIEIALNGDYTNPYIVHID